MFDRLFHPSFLLPFALITPYVFLNKTGITLFEILVILGFFLHFFKKGTLPKQNIIYIFFTFLLLGYFIASINGHFSYNLPLSLNDLKVGYWILLALAGFCLGFVKYESNGIIVKSKFFKATLIILGIFVILFPFMDLETKLFFMRPFWISPELMEKVMQINGNRFPGLGVNANIYAFMILMCFCMFTYAAIHKKSSWLYPLLTFLMISIIGSRTVMLIAVLLALGLYLLSDVSKLRKIKIFMYILVFFIFLTIFMILTETGKELQRKIVMINRVINVIEDEKKHDKVSSLENRFILWGMGMERVELAPLLGIKKSTIYDDENIIDFCCPHNEFIAYWSFTGFLGLLAFIILILGLLFKNRKCYHGYYWNGFYFALCFQMFFDGAFQYTRFIPMFFIIIGMNLKEIKISNNSYGKRLKVLTSLE
jgi:hypothetical protein